MRSIIGNRIDYNGVGALRGQRQRTYPAKINPNTPLSGGVACCCAKFETGQTFSYVQTGATTSNIVGSCCVRVGSGVQTDATTPNNVGPTM